jgi:hypothetical protein
MATLRHPNVVCCKYWQQSAVLPVAAACLAALLAHVQQFAWLRALPPNEQHGHGAGSTWPRALAASEVMQGEANST